MKLSVIVPHYGDAESLRNTLRSASPILEDSDSEIVVVINQHVSNTEGYRSSLIAISGIKRLKVLFEPKKGSYAARNTGIRHARNDNLLLLDSDVTLTEKCLIRLKEVVKQGLLKKKIYAGKIDIACGESKCVHAYEKIMEFDNARSVRKGAAPTAFLATTKDLFESIGYFREDLLSGADKTWVRKACKAGAELCYDKDMLVIHPSRGTILAIAKKYRRTYGGWYTIYGCNKAGWAKKIAYLLFALRPPLNGIARIIKDKNSGRLSKIQALGILLIIRIARIDEHIRLSTGSRLRRE